MLINKSDIFLLEPMLNTKTINDMSKLTIQYVYVVECFITSPLLKLKKLGIAPPEVFGTDSKNANFISI